MIDTDKKIMLGMVTYGNLQFTRLAIESMRSTISYPVKYFVVVGKPGDTETQKYLSEQGIEYIIHNKNYGFPKSINDIYDRCWKGDDQYDYLILAGNDIICYPYCIDSIVDTALTTDYDVVCGRDFLVQELIERFPATRRYFRGSHFIIDDFSSKPWEVGCGYSTDVRVSDGDINNMQNLALCKRNMFDIVGYTDVNFFPAYFIDCDYIKRVKLLNLKGCTLDNAVFFHFWSRTLHQESGGSSDHNFRNNRSYYIGKWGGDLGRETNTPNLIINDRSSEDGIIEHWRHI